MRILVSFLSALALLTTHSICVEAQSEAAMVAEVTPDDPVDETPGKDHCTNNLEVVRTCYDWSGPAKIDVKVTNCIPKGRDWIAIYKADTGYNEVGYDKGFGYWGHAYDWKFLCGNQACNFPISSNTNSFLNWWNNELLVDGDYRIYLFRDDGFRVDAVSESFTIKNKYHYCGGSPSHPTPHPASSPKPNPSHKPASSPKPNPSPKPTAKLTKFPTGAPTILCEEDKTVKFELWGKKDKKKNCKWAGRKINKRCNKKTLTSGVRVKDLCRRTCKECDN